MVVEEPFVPDGGAAYCDRCGGLLFRRHSQAIELCLALVTAAAIFFVVANVYPFLAFELRRRQAQIAARRALEQVDASPRSRRALDALHAAELQLPDAWLPYVCQTSAAPAVVRVARGGRVRY